MKYIKLSHFDGLNKVQYPQIKTFLLGSLMFFLLEGSF